MSSQTPAKSQVAAALSVMASMGQEEATRKRRETEARKDEATRDEADAFRLKAGHYRWVGSEAGVRAVVAIFRGLVEEGGGGGGGGGRSSPLWSWASTRSGAKRATVGRSPDPRSFKLP